MLEHKKIWKKIVKEQISLGSLRIEIIVFISLCKYVFEYIFKIVKI